MNLRINFIALILCFFLCNCSTNTSQDSTTTASPEVIEEIQQLDSLNVKIEENTKEIENSIQSVEAALKDLE